MFILNFFALLLISAWLIRFRCYWVVQMIYETYTATGHRYIEWEQCLSKSRTPIDAPKPHLECVYKVLFILMFRLNWSPSIVHGMHYKVILLATCKLKNLVNLWVYILHFHVCAFVCTCTSAQHRCVTHPNPSRTNYDLGWWGKPELIF